MAAKTVPAQCWSCYGARVLYRSAKGTLRAADLSAAELVDLLGKQYLTEEQCPVCRGSGRVDVTVSGRV